MIAGLVEVPDCTAVPQPWWESSGMTPAFFLLGLVAIVGLLLLVGFVVDTVAGVRKAKHGVVEPERPF